jgi:DNA-binding transcriptional regulator GbsR (MarR family)
MAPIRDEDEFIEAMARTLGAGMPRMAGRIWAYLAICEPPEQTAGQIADRLSASRGSVSGMTRLLEHLGLISRGTRAGDRREFFSIPPGAVRTLMGRAQQQLRADREVTAAGLALIADRPAASRARLQDIHDMYAFFEAEWPAVLERYTELQTDAGRIGSRKEASA